VSVSAPAIGPLGSGPGAPVFLRGAGDLGSGVAVALVRAGLPVVAIELPRPTALRLTVAFASASLSGRVTVGGVVGVHVETPEAVLAAIAAGQVAVWTRGEAALREHVRPRAVVDARLRGLTLPNLDRGDAPVVVALGPGYEAGRHCHYVIETNRGPRLGEVLTEGQPEAHTGVPGVIAGESARRILRSPTAGVFTRVRQIGDVVAAGEIVATVDGQPVRAQLAGLVRGLLLDGVEVPVNKKCGDVDPRCDRRLLSTPSDKAAAVGAGVLRALRLGGVAPAL